jgi:hypothetical protein
MPLYNELGTSKLHLSFSDCNAFYVFLTDQELQDHRVNPANPNENCNENARKKKNKGLE